jgi:hypothetical protein
MVTFTCGMAKKSATFVFASLNASAYPIGNDLSRQVGMDPLKNR